MKYPESKTYLFGKNFPNNIPSLSSYTKEVDNFLDTLQDIDTIYVKELISELFHIESELEQSHSKKRKIDFYAEIVQTNDDIHPTLFLTDKAVTNLLTAHPPERLNTLLIKSKGIEEISDRTKLSLTRFTENNDWQNKYQDFLKKTILADYSLQIPTCISLERNITNIILSNQKQNYKPWGLGHCKETGEIIIFNKESQKLKTPYLLTLIVFIHYLYEVHFFSKTLEPNKSIGKQLISIINKRDTAFDFLTDTNAHDETLYWRKALLHLHSVIPNYNRKLINASTNKYIYKSGAYASSNVIDILWNLNNITNHTNDHYHLQQEVWLSLEEHLSGLQSKDFENLILKSLSLNNEEFLQLVLKTSEKNV